MNTYKGLFEKYIIRRTDGKPIDPDNKYFVLKYEGDGDEKHMDACRKALRLYAEEVKDFLPDLSKDLFRRLGETPISPEPHRMTRDDVYGTWQLCPKCNGQGIVSKPPYIPGDITEWTSSAPSYECDLCSGKKIIYIPFPHTVTTKVTDEEIINKATSIWNGIPTRTNTDSWSDTNPIGDGFIKGAKWMRSLLTNTDTATKDKESGK